jgi:hypothetical protein
MIIMFRSIHSLNPFVLGGRSGDSALNFIKAMEKSPGSPVMHTVDLNPVPIVAANHHVIVKNALELNCNDLDCSKPIGLVFYDCHSYSVQMNVHKLLLNNKMIGDGTIIAFHDTGVWPNKRAGSTGCAHGKEYPGVKGFIHQNPERQMVNAFIKLGYHCVNIFPPDVSIFTPDYNLPFRHGISICQNNTYLPGPPEE